MRTKGKITHWNEDKGYGFITPSSGAKQVFVHIKAFSNHSARPEMGQIVTFSLSTDNQGRPGAMIAQQTLRHKSRKEEFRFVFWMTVVVNVGFFVWLWTESGSTLLRSLLG